jgi:hypothetical protein
MRYFRVQTGYNENQFVSIDETELETALYAFITEAKVIFKNGAIRGKDIVNIKEDWNKAMGYNSNYKLTPEDWTDIKRELGDIYKGVISEAKENVNSLITMGRTDLIGKEGTFDDRIKLLQ